MCKCMLLVFCSSRGAVYDMSVHGRKISKFLDSGRTEGWNPYTPLTTLFDDLYVRGSQVSTDHTDFREFTFRDFHCFADPTFSQIHLFGQILEF